LSRRKPRFKALVLSAVLAASAPLSIAAEGIGAVGLLGPALYAELQAKGRVLRTANGPVLSLLPAVPEAAGLRSAVAAGKPGMVVETVFMLPRKAPSDAAAKKMELASIYGLMRSFSTMKGIEYYSASRKAMRMLYEESYRIGDETGRSPLPDPPAPSAGSIPATETILVYQKDLSFGANVYRFSFRSLPDGLLVQTVNLTWMSYGIIPLVAPERFRSHLLLIPADDAIIFYSVSEADSPALVRAKLEASLSNRAEALFRWFSAKSSLFLEGK
jgi:hypothetical protein